jgi:hypothetical protein
MTPAQYFVAVLVMGFVRGLAAGAIIGGAAVVACLLTVWATRMGWIRPALTDSNGPR